LGIQYQSLTDYPPRRRDALRDKPPPAGRHGYFFLTRSREAPRYDARRRDTFFLTRSREAAKKTSSGLRPELG